MSLPYNFSPMGIGLQAATLARSDQIHLFWTSAFKLNSQLFQGIMYIVKDILFFTFLKKLLNTNTIQGKIKQVDNDEIHCSHFG